MKHTSLIMGMPVCLDIVDKNADDNCYKEVFEYFKYIDATFSTYKKTSEISRFNDGLLSQKELSTDVLEILKLADQTKKETGGYFDINKDTKIDPSGIVKGWAILNAANLLLKRGLQNFYVEAGGDIEVAGKNSKGKPWTIGIRNPFNRFENIKILSLTNHGIATSGTSIRGQHIYNPFLPREKILDIVCLTVIGPNVYEADRYATAAFAMGKKGISFIDNLDGFEGYMVDNKKTAVMTSGFEKFVKQR